MQTMQLIGKTVPRIGYGTMRLPGPNVMGPPKDHDEAIRVLRQAIELGVKVIDTAWYYGPDVSNELLAEALYPYDDLIIVTKLGGKRDETGNWLPFSAPAELREGMENDLRLLKIDSIPIVHLRWMTTNLDDSFKAGIETMIALKQEGKLQHIGLSSATTEQLDYALTQTEIATVSNPYSLDDHHDDAMVDRCAQQNIAYLPFFPLAVGKANDNLLLQKWAQTLGVSASQVALAWLLKRSPTILPIPGTSNIAHLEENVAAGNIELSDEAFAEISAG
jgi:pyridoxine 4-dehydrogenase